MMRVETTRAMNARGRAAWGVAAGALTALCVTLTSVPGAAYYLEERGTDTLVPIRYGDADASSADTVEIAYRINTSTIPDGVSATDVEGAFEAWTDVDCANAVFVRGDDSDSTNIAHWMSDAIDTETLGMPTGDIYILAFFSDSEAEWTSGPSVGHFYFAHDGTGALVGGTVVLNSRDHMWTNDGTAGSLDVQGTVTALIGRSLGITSATEGNATFPRYRPGSIDKRTLGEDDLEALRYLYPTGGSCEGPVEPEALCDGLTLPGEEACPPRPMTNPGDGGTVMPGADAGIPMSTPDAGAGGGGGGMGDTGGCSCSAIAGGPFSGGAASVLLLALGLLVRRRR